MLQNFERLLEGLASYETCQLILWEDLEHEEYLHNVCASITHHEHIQWHILATKCIATVLQVVVVITWQHTACSGKDCSAFCCMASYTSLPFWLRLFSVVSSPLISSGNTLGTQHSYMISRCRLCHSVDNLQAHLLLQVFKQNTPCSGCTTASNPAPLTDKSSSASSSIHTDTGLSMFSRKCSWRLSHEIFALSAALVLTYPKILPYFLTRKRSENLFTPYWCLTAAIFCHLSNIQNAHFPFILTHRSLISMYITLSKYNLNMEATISFKDWVQLKYILYSITCGYLHTSKCRKMWSLV